MTVDDGGRGPELRPQPVVVGRFVRCPSSAGFYGATFEGGAQFGSVTFEGGAQFGSATFEGYAGFGSATFQGYAGRGFLRFGLWTGPEIPTPDLGFAIGPGPVAVVRRRVKDHPVPQLAAERLGMFVGFRCTHGIDRSSELDLPRTVPVLVNDRDPAARCQCTRRPRLAQGTTEDVLNRRAIIYVRRNRAGSARVGGATSSELATTCLPNDHQPTDTSPNRRQLSC
ncbi:pentapeptide repeat-containing protein [Streptomyces sp. NPDC096193]|uniref:pentapeptide repeat-containing protein n=1 Tax=Streptomyces sp. NPDC096193 TaxID=3155821 RepID=UPI00332BBD29